jgi:hypothetical protein
MFSLSGSLDKALTKSLVTLTQGWKEARRQDFEEEKIALCGQEHHRRHFAQVPELFTYVMKWRLI